MRENRMHGSGGGERKPGQSGQHVPRSPRACRRPYRSYTGMFGSDDDDAGPQACSFEFQGPGSPIRRSPASRSRRSPGRLRSRRTAQSKAPTPEESRRQRGAEPAALSLGCALPPAVRRQAAVRSAPDREVVQVPVRQADSKRDEPRGRRWTRRPDTPVPASPVEPWGACRRVLDLDILGLRLAAGLGARRTVLRLDA